MPEASLRSSEPGVQGSASQEDWQSAGHGGWQRLANRSIAAAEQEIRGLLRPFGLGVGTVSKRKFAERVREPTGANSALAVVMEALLAAREALLRVLATWWPDNRQGSFHPSSARRAPRRAARACGLFGSIHGCCRARVIRVDGTRAEGGICHRVGMPSRHRNLLDARRIPDARGLILRGSHDACPAGTETAENTLPMCPRSTAISLPVGVSDARGSSDPVTIRVPSRLNAAY